MSPDATFPHPARIPWNIPGGSIRRSVNRVSMTACTYLDSPVGREAKLAGRRPRGRWAISSKTQCRDPARPSRWAPQL